LYAAVTESPLNRQIYIYKKQKQEPGKVIDPREKKRIFEDIIAENDAWLSFIARNNAPIDSCEDLKQEILMAFWESLDSYRERSKLKTFLFSVARHTAIDFRRNNHTMKKREKNLYANANPVFVEQDRDLLRIIEEFMGKLAELDRQIFTMHLDALSYPEMSEALGIAEVNLRKRISRIKEQFLSRYKE
jgi:RNA polymerase sigma-70 factor, ECF subfamily